MSFSLTFLFILQIIVALLLIFIVLMQSSDEDALSNISSGSNRFGSLSRKSSVDFVTKLTIGLGSVLMVNSFLLASLSTHKYAKEETTIKEYLKNKSKSSEQGKKDIEDKSNDNVLDNSKENTKNQ